MAETRQLSKALSPPSKPRNDAIQLMMYLLSFASQTVASRSVTLIRIPSFNMVFSASVGNIQQRMSQAE